MFRIETGKLIGFLRFLCRSLRRGGTSHGIRAIFRDERLLFRCGNSLRRSGGPPRYRHPNLRISASRMACSLRAASLPENSPVPVCCERRRRPTGCRRLGRSGHLRPVLRCQDGASHCRYWPDCPSRRSIPVRPVVGIADRNSTAVRSSAPCRKRSGKGRFCAGVGARVLSDR